MFRNLKLGRKLIIAFLMVGVLPFIIVGMASLQQASSALKKQSFIELRMTQASKKKELDNYFGQISRTVKSICSNETMTQALVQFTSAFKAGGTEGEWASLDSFMYGPTIAETVKTYGYDDLYLISSTGDIVYSLKKAGDLGQNLVSGKSEGVRPCGRLQKIRKAVHGLCGCVALCAGRQQAAAFIVGKVAGQDDGTWIGAIAIPLPLTEISRITVEAFRTGGNGRDLSGRPRFPDAFRFPHRSGQPYGGSLLQKSGNRESGYEIGPGGPGGAIRPGTQRELHWEQMSCPPMNPWRCSAHGGRLSAK